SRRQRAVRLGCGVQPPAAGERDGELREGGPARPGEDRVGRDAGRRPSARSGNVGRAGGRGAMSATVATATWQPRVSPWIIAASVMLATFMEVLDTSIANVALPHIAGNLSASTDEATWVLTSYLVSNDVILPATARRSRRFGRKRCLIACIAIFTLASFASGAATSLGMLVLARILQGV